MEHRDVRVSSFSELHERLYADSWNDALRRFRSRCAFRGVCDAAADLSTSLDRLAGPDRVNLESHILRNFRKYAVRDGGTLPFVGDSLWNWLAMAQHYGLPTRLLDWTFSPYVALHFMTQDVESFHLDGAVAHARLPQVLRRALEGEQADVFTAEMLDAAGVDSLAKLGALQEDDADGGDGQNKPFVVFLEPPSLDQRIVNQFALFSLMNRPAAQLDHWLSHRPEICQRLVAPAELKWEIRDKLDQANITERVLFPGLDGLSRWLKRYYTPRL
jgi:hypothetical protein